MAFGPFDLITLTLEEARVLRDFVLEHTRHRLEPHQPSRKTSLKVVEVFWSLDTVIRAADRHIAGE
jgi:hypothetical protein